MDRPRKPEMTAASKPNGKPHRCHRCCFRTEAPPPWRGSTACIGFQFSRDTIQQERLSHVRHGTNRSYHMTVRGTLSDCVVVVITDRHLAIFPRFIVWCVYGRNEVKFSTCRSAFCFCCCRTFQQYLLLGLVLFCVSRQGAPAGGGGGWCWRGPNVVVTPFLVLSVFSATHTCICAFEIN